MRLTTVMLGVALLGLVLLGVAGCATTSSQQASQLPAPSERAPVTAEQDVVAEQQQRLRLRQQQVDRLLELAEHALASDRLMIPQEDNAFGWYQQVLDLDEFNSEAHWGMRRITQRYLQLAEQAYQKSQSGRAEQFLHGALQVAATPAQVELVREKYRDQIRETEFVLPPGRLRARDEALQHTLAEIAQRAKEQDLRLLIVAPSDAEGRWIYKQMRDAVDGFRLRGNIEVGNRPRVVLIDI